MRLCCRLPDFFCLCGICGKKRSLMEAFTLDSLTCVFMKMDCFARTESVARNDVNLFNPPCARQFDFIQWRNAICSPARFPFVAKCHLFAGSISARGKTPRAYQLDFRSWQNAICPSAHFLPVAALRQNPFRGIIALTDASLAPETFFQAKSGKLWTTYLTTQNHRSSRLQPK